MTPKTATKPRRPLPTIRVADLPKSDRLPPAGRRLMAKALTAMVRYPEAVDMQQWYTHSHTTHTRTRKLPAPFCGTVACLAGHITLAAGIRPRRQCVLNNSVMKQAAKLIGLRLEKTTWGDPQTPAIFDSINTVTGLGYPDAPAARVRAVVARVKHWLRTGE